MEHFYQRYVPIQVLNHYNRLNSNYPFFRVMITAVFMHKCTSMMEPGLLVQPILLALQTIQELNLISIMIHILDCLQAVNPYIPLYNQAHDVLHQGQSSVVHLRLAVPPGVDISRYNLPTANEIVAILSGAYELATTEDDLGVSV